MPTCRPCTISSYPYLWQPINTACIKDTTFEGMFIISSLGISGEFTQKWCSFNQSHILRNVHKVLVERVYMMEFHLVPHFEECSSGVVTVDCRVHYLGTCHKVQSHYATSCLVHKVMYDNFWMLPKTISNLLKCFVCKKPFVLHCFFCTL